MRHFVRVQPRHAATRSLTNKNQCLRPQYMRAFLRQFIFLIPVDM